MLKALTVRKPHCPIEKQGDLCSREKCQRAIQKKRKARPVHCALGVAQAMTDTCDVGGSNGQQLPCQILPLGASPGMDRSNRKPARWSLGVYRAR